MATLGNIPLFGGETPPTAGAFFSLATPARETEVQRLDHGWEVQVTAGSDTVIARGGKATDFETAEHQALVAVNRALDLLSVRGVNQLSVIRHGENGYGVWWLESIGPVVRLVTRSVLSFNMGRVSVTVRDAEGREIKPLPPPPTWHPSFRYFRLSQLTTDASEAFRSLFLALESILSEIEPPRVTSDGRMDERENAWFRRALRAAGAKVDLRVYAPDGSSDPAGAIYDELYVNMRTAIFHAKQGCRTYLPHDTADRSAVMVNLQRLAKLYLNLVEHQFRHHYITQGIFAGFFASGAVSMLENAALLASDEGRPIDPTDTCPNPSGGPLVPLEHTAPHVLEPFLVTMSGSAPVTRLAALRKVQRFVLVDEPSGDPLFVGGFDHPLTLDGFTRLEYCLYLQGRNVWQVKKDYAT